ncbi:MAG: hypothetical protein C0598_00745, partial [Marinilabiliales bacterium]
YNIAFIVQEWRSGIKVGSVRRDMQIIISACDNDPPEISTIDDTCVIAGDYLMFDAIAWDPDGNSVTLEAYGGPFEINPNAAFINPDPAISSDTAKTTFNWPTLCSHVRKEPYSTVFKATDDDGEISLVNFKTTFISVNAPAPENLMAEPLGNGIDLSWDKSPCDNAIGYYVYRRSDSSGWNPSYCETGVPAYTGFIKIDEMNDINIITYRDDNQGSGLVHGINYCYRITAFFNDDAESYASNESCASLKRDVPIITHVSNDSNFIENGNVEVIWSKPIDLDTIQYPGPYSYIIYRNEGLNWTNPVLIAELQDLDDTIYYDSEVNINMLEVPLKYMVDLESSTVGYIGSSQKASSVFLNTEPRDKEIYLTWNVDVPWNNYKAIIYRRSEGQINFDSVGFTETFFYRDRGLENDTEYCYYIKMLGEYSIDGIIKPLINYSQISCEVPNDNTPPCEPEISVYTDCEQISNEIRMWLPYDSCSYDAMRYFIYYIAPGSSETVLVDSTDYISGDTSFYLHTNLESVVGCYYVTARDTVGNISIKSATKCIDYDACPVYELPNVFTPNGDGFNDLLVPLNYDDSNPKATVERIDLRIFNRWGRTLFTTEDPQINWDGKNQNNGQDLPDGVYFYVCDVYFVSLDGIQNFRLQGSVTIIRGQ